ncbi:hypothetical protein [Ruegeria sp. ANG-R]|uniref:hypothetical protein n=1 Tax=Ruegeria sp. ANG-R TaxID=1577903 RepID=UPI001269C3F8|nr:hypothetical protein [Ruegeria sp. ANG-R]
MADVADICGEDVALQLCERLPGIVVNVPKVVIETGYITKLDVDIAERLVAGFGGDRVYVPSQRPTFRETFAAIECLVDKGLTVPQIALRLGYTESWVRRCRKKAGAPQIPNKPDPRQLPLF